LVFSVFSVIFERALHYSFKKPNLMHFEPNVIYHVYNQGNNRQPIFFSNENYLYFLRKTRTYIAPHVHFLAYCLMPNHFHWLIVTKVDACDWMPLGSNSKAYPRQRLNHQINTLLRSYTRAINKQENRSGSLFRQHTQAKNGWLDEFIEPLKRHNTTDGFMFGTGNDYASQCFRYIHENPSEAGITIKSTDWIFSSARDYAGLRQGNLCNQELAKELLRI